MNKPTLVILAAGIGSRYGGLKQLDTFSEQGDTILDFSIYDAIQAGFGKVVFIIRKSIETEFKAFFNPKLEIIPLDSGLFSMPDQENQKLKNKILEDMKSNGWKYSYEMPYYDLGVNGSALQPMYYSLPEQIGRSTGFHAYEPYYKRVEDFKYYDTKSPFINLEAVFGGKQRSIVDFEFSRNINPQWNVGFDIYKINSNKQVGSAGLREKQVENTELDIYTFHRSEGGPKRSWPCSSRWRRPPSGGGCPARRRPTCTTFACWPICSR